MRYQPKLPHLDPGRQQRALRWPEEDTERAVDQGCALLHIASFSTVTRYKRQACPRCGHLHTPQGGYGSTPGVPDRILVPEWLPPYLGILVELKGSHTAPSPEQAELARRGVIAVARDWDDVAAVLEEVKARVR